MITKIWYSIRNNGDGSAGIVLMESKELVELDQEYADEGFAEDCSGCISVESNFPIKILGEVLTVEDVIKETKEDMKYDDEYFKEKLKS